MTRAALEDMAVICTEQGRLMRTVEGRTDRVVVVGAGLSGLSAALHLAGRGRARHRRRTRRRPGGRVGRADISGYRLDTGPTVLTMPDIIDDAFAAVGESLSDRARTAAGAPGLPRDVRRRQRAGGAHRGGRDVRRDRAVRRRAEGRGLPAAARLADRAVPHRVRRVHRRQLRLAAVPADPAAGPAGRAGRVPALGQGGAPVPQRRAAAAGVHLPGRCTPGSRRRARWRCTP